MKFIIKNKYLFIITIILLLIVTTDFKSIKKSEMANLKMYYDCKDNNELFYCAGYDKSYEEYNGSDTPLLMINVFLNDYSSMLPYIVPLLIMFAVIADNYKQFKYNVIKEKIQRQNYKSYLKKLFLSSYKYCIILPIVYIMVFLLCYNLSGHFYYRGLGDNVTYSLQALRHFGIFFSIMLLNGVFHTILWANISLINLRKFKNLLITFISSVFTFISLELFNEIVMQKLICGKILNFNGAGFNLLDIFVYEEHANMYSIILISLFYTLVSVLIVYLFYKNKEKLVIDCDKEC